VKKADIIIIALIIIVAATIYLALSFKESDVEAEDLLVEVYYDGELYDSGSLMTNKVITVETELGFNVIAIEEGAVSMSEADCKDGICIKSGAIDSIGEYIVCLPHKVHVEITGNSEEGLDAISQ
jgi:hypothetical protein